MFKNTASFRRQQYRREAIFISLQQAARNCRACQKQLAGKVENAAEACISQAASIAVTSSSFEAASTAIQKQPGLPARCSRASQKQQAAAAFSNSATTAVAAANHIARSQ